MTRAFRYLIAGRTVTTAGNALAPIALAFAVLDLTGSAADLGLVVGARSLMNVLLLLFGGVLADRLPRQRIMVASSLLAMVTQAAVAALILTGIASIPVLIGLSMLNGAAAAFAHPAAAAMVPQTVPAERLQSANAVSRLCVNAATISGAAVGGILVATVGPGWGIAIDAVTFGVAAGSFALIRVPPYRSPAVERQHPLRDLRDGWSEFASRTWVWVVVIGFCFFNAAQVGALNVIGPVVADQTIGRPAWGLVVAAGPAGMVVGAFVAMRLRVRRFLPLGLACCLGGALWVAAIAVSSQLAVLLPVSFVAGVGVEQFVVAWEVSIQEHVPADRLARVYSFDAVGSYLAIPLGQVAAGPVAVAVGPRAALLSAAGVMAVAVVGMLASTAVRTLVHEVPQTTAEPALAP